MNQENEPKHEPKYELALPRVMVFGAGCIGNYLAGSLLPFYQETPNKLSIIARQSMVDKVNSSGLTVTDYLGNKHRTPSPISISTVDAFQAETPAPEVPETEAPEILLLTVKCTAVDASIDDIKKLINDNTIIVALQNGIGSESHLIQAFPNNKVLTGIVGFNVVGQADGHYHRGTEGEVLIEHADNVGLTQLVEMFNQQHIPSELVANIEQVRWGKLLLNLNNAINALSDIPLKSQLEQASYRKVLAACMREALAALKRLGITPAKLTKVSPNLVPVILSLPNWLFKRVANQMLAIDPLARSSMWYDIGQNKITEIDYINGAVISLAEKARTKAPANTLVVRHIKEAEKAKNGSPAIKADKLLSGISNE